MESTTMTIIPTIASTIDALATCAFGDRSVLGLTTSRGDVLRGTGLSVGGAFAGAGRSVAARSSSGTDRGAGSGRSPVLEFPVVVTRLRFGRPFAVTSRAARMSAGASDAPGTDRTGTSAACSGG